MSTDTARRALPRRGTLCAVTLATIVWLVPAETLDGRADDIRGRNAKPDYARVFDQDRVGRLDLKMAASDWQVIVSDMTDMAGSPGGTGGGGGIPGGGAPGGGAPGGGIPGGGAPGAAPEAVAACDGLIEGSACSFGTPPVSGRCVLTGAGTPLACTVIDGGGGAPRPGGGVNDDRDDVDLLPRTPVYVPTDLSFDGQTFRNVGFRLKGNSSLVTSWRSGTEKLPFRLNMDALEDRYVEARDQTFFGFTNLSFSNNALDSSYLRAKVVTDLFGEAGLPVSRTAFMRVYLDRGAGPIYLGLYTMIEVPDRAMLERVFQSSAGNLYKPHSSGGRWTVFYAGDFPKHTNDGDGDWTDIEDAIAALNASKTDRALWRQRLDARFDVSGFLRWLALNTMVANNDAYGGLSAHNYYLYGSPRHRDRLFWIPWDHDLSLPTGGTGIGGGPGGGAGALDLFHSVERADQWPLIRFLMDDPVYRATYRSHLESLLTTVFEPARLGATFRSEQARIAPYVIGADAEDPSRSFAGTPAQFDATVYGPSGLVAYVQSRAAAVRAALGASQ